jgi:hypothetical protein
MHEEICGFIPGVQVAVVDPPSEMNMLRDTSVGDRAFDSAAEWSRANNYPPPAPLCKSF